MYTLKGLQIMRFAYQDHIYQLFNMGQIKQMSDLYGASYHLYRISNYNHINFVNFRFLIVKMSLFLQQCRGIMVTNIILAYKKQFFWKLLGIQLAFIAYLALQVLLKKQDDQNIVVLSSLQNILVIILINQFLVLQYIDNSQRFIEFQKSYGLSIYAYIFTWIIYCIGLGLFEILAYCGLLSIFFQILVKYDSDSIQTYFFKDLCIWLILTFLSTFSYFLCCSVLIPSKQIGLKIVTAIFVEAYILSVLAINGIQIQLIQWGYSTPIGLFLTWTYDIAKKIIVPTTFSYNIYYYQLFLPLFLAILIQILKYQFPNIKSWLSKFRKQNKKKIMNQSLLTDQTELREIYSENEVNVQKTVLLQVNCLSKTINKLKILNNLNLIINTRQTVLLCGKNGSGKSTFLKIITKDIIQDEGFIKCRQDLKIGISYEDNYFYNQLTVKENLIFYSEIKGVSNISKKINSLLYQYELHEFQDKKFIKISYGNQRKLSVACAFLGNNDLVILDQPLMGIDSKAKNQMIKIFQKKKYEQPNVSIIILTCDPQMLMLNLANRVLWLDNGKLILNQQMNTFYKRSQIFYLRFYPIKSQSAINNTHITRLVKNHAVWLNLKQQCNQYLQYEFMQSRLGEIYKLIPLFQQYSQIQIMSPTIKDKINSRIAQATNYCCKKQKRQKINLYLDEIQKQSLESSFLRQILATLIIKYYQITPNPITKLYFAIGYMVISSYFIFLIYHQRENGWQYTVISLFPQVCMYIYLHVATSELQFKASSYEITTFTQGLKPAPYWITGLLFNILLISIPNTLFFISILIREKWAQMTLSNTMFNLYSYATSFTAVCYCYTIFFRYSFVCFSVITAIFKLSQYLIHLMINYSIASNYLSVVTFLRMIGPQQIQTQCFNTWGGNQCWYVPFLQSLLYIAIFAAIHVYSFLARISEKDIDHSQISQIMTDDAIYEKKKVQDLKTTQHFAEILLENIYLKFPKKTVIKGINLEVKKGTSFAFMGHNGSGKSTLLKVITAQIGKTKGNIWLDGQQIESQHSEIFEKFGICPQVMYLIPEMTVISHLRTLFLMKGVPIKYIVKLLDIFQMKDYQDKQIKQLSGGVKKKLTLISAFIGLPKYLFLDEPNIGIDEHAQSIFGQFFDALISRFSTTAIWITHNIEEAEQHCQKVGIMKHGELIKINQPTALMRQYSRGYNLKFTTSAPQKLKQQMIPELDQEFRVYEHSEVKDERLFNVSIPYNRFDMIKCLNIANMLKQRGLCQSFQIRFDKLPEVFAYLQSRNPKEL